MLSFGQWVSLLIYLLFIFWDVKTVHLLFLFLKDQYVKKLFWEQTSEVIMDIISILQTEWVSQTLSC